ncbi:helix-turn-helix transcriptional regulator [Alicyclobacillus mali]|uniref:Helix-turn-helix transcriptional regulator n=1 Tax=Alicyclobacillus mali (ex Roth et al. 2021) TaxID=1123961 RepID=A0ABS0F3U8_9BACL|nr:helix-turn-helix domain-containing protein [Alicyclobacillus mali (ex Roth et al. 2021)]MBF8377911.1 helix-turn-helix transcriptional regulator [Alicyclobacillus mali (ex Roth et al. 2021)]MCL6488955.1 helix-turn-helix domain-containing protein [Alicyclobacillus mali (ex Roth et al. 2021)]
MSLGERLRRLREERGLTLAQVASAAGLSVSHLSAIENGTRRNPSFHIVARIARVYNVPVDSLVDEEDKRHGVSQGAEAEHQGPTTPYLEMARRLAEADALSHPARLLEVIAALLREQEQAYDANSQGPASASPKRPSQDKTAGDPHVYPNHGPEQEGP